jgi:hypothetical protein
VPAAESHENFGESSVGSTPILSASVTVCAKRVGNGDGSLSVSRVTGRRG